MIVFQKALIPRKLPCPKKFLVTRLINKAAHKWTGKRKRLKVLFGAKNSEGSKLLSLWPVQP